MMAAVFAEDAGNAEDAGDASPLSIDYLVCLLERESFWAIAAFAGNEVVGGITAHTLPMTRSQSSEVFIYDLAVRQDYQRQGLGSRLVGELIADAAAVGINVAFVPADNEDRHALDFYRAQGAVAAPVTIFTFTAR